MRCLVYIGRASRSGSVRRALGPFWGVIEAFAEITG